MCFGAGILTAIPYGFMADKYGRKPVFLLSIFGVLLNVAGYEAICKLRYMVSNTSRH